ncbi:MAG: GFA family protein [Lentisphaeraceae bacterium]|nr:GFA family protein [Lentisphaeraceae bacterium]
MSKEVQGKCLCGAVKVKAQKADDNVGACHCSMCRKWTGGPLLVVDCQSSVKFTGEEHITSYKSSDWAERGFCSKCGTHLFYRLLPKNQYMVPAGFFGNENELKFDHQIFMDEKPDYYSFANDTLNMTGAEVFAMFEDENQ